MVGVGTGAGSIAGATVELGHVRSIALGLLVFGLDACQSPIPASYRVERARPVMGTLFRVEVQSPDSLTGIRWAQAAFDSVALVDSLLSNYRDDSEVKWVSGEVGRWLGVSDIFASNLRLAEKASLLTGGAFDITLSGQMGKISLDTLAKEVRLSSVGVTLDFGGSAKGDALDRALRAVPEAYDVLVDLGGQTAVRSSNGATWQLAIVDPSDVERVFAIIEVSSGSVATSATYELGDHVVDPLSGESPDDLISASVYHESAGWADALSTGMFVMGASRALALADSMNIAFLGVKKGEGELGVDQIVVSSAMNRIVALRDFDAP